MYTIFKNSLFNLQALAINVKDKWLKVWSYFFLLVILSLIPFMILEYSSSSFTGSQKKAIIENYTTYISGDFKIVDGIINGDETLIKQKGMSLDLYGIYFMSEPSTFTDRIVILNFTKDGIELKLAMMTIDFYNYKSLGLSNYDFNNNTLENKQIFLSALTKVLDNNIEFNKIIHTVFYFISSCINFLIFGLFGSITMIKIVNFKSRYKISLYLLAPVMIFDLFAVLFNLYFLTYIGFFIYILNARKVFITRFEGVSDE